MKTTYRQTELLFLLEDSILKKDVHAFKRILSNCIDYFLEYNKKALFKFSYKLNELDRKKVPVYAGMKEYYCQSVASYYKHLH